MPVPTPASLSTSVRVGQLARPLVDLLVQVPVSSPFAFGVVPLPLAPGASLDDAEFDLWLRELDCADLVCALAGTVVPSSWLAFGIVAPGDATNTVAPGDATDTIAPGDATDTIASGDATDTAAPGDADVIEVTAAVLVERSGAVHAAWWPADAGTTGAVAEGRVVDACRRALELPTAPATSTVGAWQALRFVDACLAEVLDVDLGTSVQWAQLAALDPHPPGRAQPSWRALRRRCARGTAAVPGVDADAAAWMDDGMFSREAIGAFPSLCAMLTDLRDLLPPATFDHVVARVCEHLSPS